MAKTHSQNDKRLAQSKEMRKLVDDTLADMAKYEELLIKSDDPEEQKMRIKQMYFNNLKQAGTPLTLSQRVLADLLTRADIDRMNGGDTEAISDKYLKILEQINKNIKLTNEMANKGVSVNVQHVNDSNMKIVDADVVAEMFKEGD